MLNQKNVLFCGDFNLHYEFEQNYIYENNIMDLWAENKQSKGYTWDPKTNSLINKFLIFDDRRMRLDRFC